MKVYPDASLRLVAGDSMELQAGFTPARAVVTPTLGDPVEVAASDGSVVFPSIHVPNVCTVGFYAEGGEEAGAVVYVEAVSRHYFPLDALSAFGDGRDGFDELPEEVLFAARQAATEVFERGAQRSFVRRLGRTKDYGRNQFLHLMHNDCYQLVTEGYHQVSGSQVQRLVDGIAFPAWVQYEYGVDEVPSEVSRSVLELAAYMLRPSNRPIGATGESTDAGYIHFTTAGRDGVTDIPEVNAAMEQFGAGETYLW